jgi:hypothetical protein
VSELGIVILVYFGTRKAYVTVIVNNATDCRKLRNTRSLGTLPTTWSCIPNSMKIGQLVVKLNGDSINLLFSLKTESRLNIFIMPRLLTSLILGNVKSPNLSDTLSHESL